MRTEDVGYCIKTDGRLEWFERHRYQLERRVREIVGLSEPLDVILERNDWKIVRCKRYLEELLVAVEVTESGDGGGSHQSGSGREHGEASGV